ncbi:MAG: hypothetical protein ABI697_11130 [Devosia sp.]
MSVVTFPPPKFHPGALAQVEAILIGIEAALRAMPDEQLEGELQGIIETMPGSPWAPASPATIVGALIEAEQAARARGDAA